MAMTAPVPPTLALIHTVAGLVPLFDGLAARHLPGHARFAMLDESLLRATLRDGRVSTATTRRLAAMVWSAEDAGAGAVVVTCSTLGPTVEALRPLCGVPLLRIDEGMALAAVAAGRRIGVAATVPTTLGPTAELLRRTAAAGGRDCEIVEALVEGAFARLSAGDATGHDGLVADALTGLARDVDVVVLAQASMARALPAGTDRLGGVPLLTSPELGMRRVAEVLAG
jgi:Asp/Glu/hydantoin racemase